MEAFWVSTGVVALGEIGDKTQLLALVLAARFRKPLPIAAGILVATLANHALAGALGAWIAEAMSPATLRWVLAVSFFAMAIWVLIPDQLDGGAGDARGRFGVFGLTTIAFFVAEMGDKTQIATVVLAAKYAEFWPVVAGTTAGMMLVNLPVVLIGNAAAPHVALKPVRIAASLLFAALGVLALVGRGFG